ncbi:LOW QUALITY PROTEIN: hypothetical protein BRADI_4g45156v3 [Brachypodium distachyon]|uniref:Uncharacterized protein n=1 Tax=Brachypodium distachyon TaxID=15368 RepID=A0A2K2CUA5_BRADI|nr:LOW QUALITY PROTEIN: hypothetical protein BRADI_4g45156v3 [Brachypodium distachyon]
MGIASPEYPSDPKRTREPNYRELSGFRPWPLPSRRGPPDFASPPWDPSVALAAASDPSAAHLVASAAPSMTAAAPARARAAAGRRPKPALLDSPPSPRASPPPCCPHRRPTLLPAQPSPTAAPLVRRAARSSLPSAAAPRRPAAALACRRARLTQPSRVRPCKPPCRPPALLLFPSSSRAASRCGDHHRPAADHRCARPPSPSCTPPLALPSMGMEEGHRRWGLGMPRGVRGEEEME